MGNERKKINLTDIDENSIVASFKEGRPADGQAQAAGNKGQSGEESGKSRADPYPDDGGRERDFRQKYIFP